MDYSSEEEREALFSSTNTGAEDKQSEYRSLGRQESSSSVSSEESVPGWSFFLAFFVSLSDKSKHGGVCIIIIISLAHLMRNT